MRLTLGRYFKNEEQIVRPSKQVCWEIGEVTDTEGEGRDGRGGQGKVAVIVHLQCSCLGTTSQEKTPVNLISELSHFHKKIIMVS